MTRIAVDIRVLEAAARLLDKDTEGLRFAGSQEAAEQFTKDVLMVAEAIARLAEGAAA